MRGWLAACAGLGAADAVCDANGWPTFSDLTRRVFRTDTPAGRVVFIGAFCVFAYWFPAHILKEH